MSAWLWPAGLLLLAVAGATEARGGERGAVPPRTSAPEAVDAEMLRDLDLLSSPDYSRDREVARRMGFLERLRMLESQPAADGAASPETGGGPAPAPAPARSGR